MSLKLDFPSFWVMFGILKKLQNLIISKWYFAAFKEKKEHAIFKNQFLNFWKWHKTVSNLEIMNHQIW